MKAPNKWMVAFGLVYAALNLYVLFHLYFGTSRFLTTTVVYSWGTGLLFWLYTKYPRGRHWFFSGLMMWLTLFVAEFTLRYVVQKNVTYSELNNGRYVSNYHYDRMVNFQFLTIEGRADAHTNEYKPNQPRNYSGDTRTYPTEYCNSLGTRGKLPQKNKQVTYVLGDSFAEGVGTPADSTFAVLLEQQWQTADSNQAVLNLGVAGFDLFLSWNLLQKHFTHYRPKQVVMLLNTTDIGEVMTRGGKERFLPNGKVSYAAGPWWEPLYAVSFVSRLLFHQFLQLDWFLLSPTQSAGRKQQAIDKIASFINNDIAQWAAANEVKFTIVLHPLQHEVEKKQEDYHCLITGLNENEWVKIYDLQPVIHQQYGKHPLYWPMDQHFLPQGYAILAKLVADSCTSISPRK